MRGQQLSPWSFYNQQPNNQLNFGIQKYKKAQRSDILPKIGKFSPPMPPNLYKIQAKFSKKKSSLPHSMVASTLQTNFINNKKPYPQQSNLSPGRQLPQYESLVLQNKKLSLIKQMEDSTLLSIILHQLKLQKDNDTFLQLQKESVKQEPQQKHEQRQELKFPKIQKYKRCSLSSCKIGQQTKSKQINHQVMDKMLKQKIQSLITRKLKALGHSKQIIVRTPSLQHYYSIT